MQYPKHTKMTASCPLSRIRSLQARWALAAAFTTIWLATGCSGPDRGPDDELSRAQQASLEHVFYAGNPLPPAPDNDELAEAEETVAAAEPEERDFLNQLYGDAPELRALAIRDSDKDGIFDFRISDDYGRFMEGDTDIDGDGISNVLDAAPYIASAENSVGDTLPPHVSWSTAGKPPAMVDIQHELFDRHGILLVDRSAEFTAPLAQAVNDTVHRVYSAVFANDGRLPTLRVIATEEYSLLFEDEETAGDFAQVLPANQTMEIYRRGIDANPAIQLGYLAHELGHNLQFAMDYDAQRQAEIVHRNYFAASNFHALVEKFGWTVEDWDEAPDADYDLFRPQYSSQEPYGYLYLGRTPEEWDAELVEIYAETGEADYLTDERLVSRHILGDYSVSNPWEWHSDHIIAYVYLAMLESLQSVCSPEDLRQLELTFQRDTVQGEWPYFRFANATGAPIQKHLQNTLAMSDTSARQLANDYLLALHPEYCGEEL